MEEEETEQMTVVVNGRLFIAVAPSEEGKRVEWKEILPIAF